MSSLLTQAREAWNNVIGELRYTLNRADYEAWVRDARPIAYDSNVLTVGVANSYARDWLESRLRPTLETNLRAILNKPIALEFVVAEPRSQLPNGTIVPQGNTIPRSPGLDLSALSLRLRDALIQPQRVIFLPGYFLRWLPYIGTRAAWLYVALRQAHFLANLAPHGRGHRIPAGQAVEVQRATLAHWSGLTPRTINNILNRGLLSPLVQVERDRHLYANRQAPNRYIFTADLPLTPHDFQAVMEFLEAHGLDSDPVGALAQAIQQPAVSLLAEDDALGGDPPETAQTLRDAVAARLQSRPLSQEQLAKAIQMAEILESTILESAGKIFISWYFIRRHLPRIGHTVAWIYIMLRHKAERSGRRGSGGFRIVKTSTREIARSVRLKKVRYVRELIPALPLDAPADLHIPPAAAFVRREASRSQSFQVAVQTVEPLTPSDEAAYRAATMFMAACIQNKDLEPLLTVQGLVQNGETATAINLLREAIGMEVEQSVLRRAVEALAAVSTKAPNVSFGETGENPHKRQKVPAEMPKSSLGNAKSFPRDRQNLPPK